MLTFHPQSQKTFRTRLLGLAIVISLGAPATVWADLTGTCFHFLNAQDYPRATIEAQTLLKRKGLAREDERYTQLCLGQSSKQTGRYREALLAFVRAEALSRSTEVLATAYSWLGSTYVDLNDLDREEL